MFQDWDCQIYSNITLALPHSHPFPSPVPLALERLPWILKITTPSLKKSWIRPCKCCQQQLRSRWALFFSNALCLVNLLALTIFENICLPLFLHKLTSIYRQNWPCEKIPKSQNSDKATSFSSVVVNIASSVQKVSYSKPLHNKSRCLNTMKSFLAFKVISTWIFVYFQKGFTKKLRQNTQFTTAILFGFVFTA